MKITTLLLYILIILNACRTSNDGEKQSKIMSVDMTDLEQILNDDKIFTFLIVYTHWCQRSSSLLENVQTISNLLKYDSHVKIAKMNAAVNSAVIDKLSVYSYPSLFMLKKNEMHKYKGVNSIKGIMLWIYGFLDDSVYSIENKNKLDVFLQLDEYNNSILFFINRKEKDSHLLKELINICTLTGNTFCFAVTNPSIISYFENQVMREKYHFNLEDLQSKNMYGILFKNDDFDQYFYLIDNSVSILYNPGSSVQEKKQELTKWIQKKIESLVIKFSEYYFPLFFSNDTVTFFILYDDIHDLNKSDIIKCAKKYPNITFSVSGNKEVYEKRLLNELLIQQVKKPVMRITEFKNHISVPYKYRPLSDAVEINEQSIDQFIQDYLNEKKHFYRKSEKALPDEFNHGYIKIIVADTYDEYVFDSTKHVVVLYYAPWCGHCYKFEPVYREIGKRLKLYGNKFKDYNNDVVIAKIDAVNNEIYDVPIEGYPTIYLYTKENKKAPIRYRGPRTVESIISWICEKTNTDIDIQKFRNINLDDEQLFETYEEL
ncbi:protein disulfide-isomerase, putative [Plasmodium vivax]|uniref:Protein disulfide isomerase, putative n=1 Tax=Plasmodium vivax (strain Salvador I) TaxID=126793 RepID=A5K333_PLAVS|nr:protein disulfide isomerase, putative [Plasmodium vivax]EDL45937.1 protein disulfide isomerase, putative [Plasmodium vivax]CAI7722154.1 protein disulfide-isomerase, putative [Plasmodium vivax]|eukprot:XP_001615664.1 protein disulfide isomerase [Plasmodium vivax Sal-1]